MNTALDTKLLPCPHCGGDAELDTGQAYRALSDGAIGSRAVVYCTRCGADVGFCYEDARGTPREDIVDQVVDDWNRRVSPSQGEGPAADVVERLQGWLDGTFAYAAYRGKAPDGVPQFRDDLRAALASLAPRAAQGALADEQSGETSHIAVSDAMVEAATREWRRVHASGEATGFPEAMRAAITAALGASPDRDGDGPYVTDAARYPG